MSNPPIICKATRDTYMRFAIVLAAFLGFGLYFFYDAAIGYRKANAAILSYQAFASLGEAATRHTEAQWEQMMQRGALLDATPSPETLKPETRDRVCVTSGDTIHVYPILPGLEATQDYPAEVRDHAAMARSWNDQWMAYSARMHYPIKPGDHPHDVGAIREQWYGGSVCMLVSAVLLAFIIRTSRRELSLRGDTICAAGQRFSVADIERIDLRQWGPGFKGAAWFTVKGRRLKADGMTYGGFNKQQGEPAEQFMQAILARYEGEIIDYEREEAPATR